VPDRSNKEFELRGINHLALVCEDMARTVDFYSNVLGMPLIKTIDLPGGMGQHFFFDIGNGDSLAFFWFPEAPDRAPGVASPARMVGTGSLATAHGSMNHVAFDVAPEKMEEYRERLIARGIEVTEILNHDNSPLQASPTVTDDVFVRSMYFFDPDGVLLEFAAWTRELRPEEARLEGARPADKERYLELQRRFMERMRKAARKRG
jgi:catechol 2,3-dioxygenase-like lactoylglutathione lyase family enzyme